jgi:ATP-dependent Clp protease ATP-binding subunit ClpA
MEFYISSEGFKVSTNRAIFGFLSDFGAPGKTDGMDFYQVKNLLYAETKRLWGEPRLAIMIQNYFPFMPLSQEEMEELVKRKLSEICKEAFPRLRVFITREAVRNVVSSIQTDYHFEYGRGVYKYLINYVIPELDVISRENEEKREVLIDVMGKSLKFTHELVLQEL